MLPPAQQLAMPGGTTGKQGNVLEVARERVGFVSLAIAMIWSSFVSALADRTREPLDFRDSQCGSTPCRTDRDARESRQPRNTSLRLSGNLKDGGAAAARISIPYLFGTLHPDGEPTKTNRSHPKYVIITLFFRRLIGPTQPQPETSPPWWRARRRSGAPSGTRTGTTPVLSLLSPSARLPAPAPL
jgi:hypothetical protein